MKIEIRQITKYSSALSKHVEEKMRSALNRFSRKVRSIKVTLRDINGPKGGLDKKCQFLVKLKSKVLVLEGVEDNFYKAVDSNIERLVRVVSREMNKRIRVRHTA